MLNFNDSLQQFYQNNKEFQPFKDLFEETLSLFDSKFSEYNFEVNYDNFSVLLNKLKVKFNELQDEIVKYNKSDNNISINVSKIKEIDDSQYLTTMFAKPVLNMFTNVYNIENDKYNLGLEFELNNEIHGKYLNEKIGDRIIELFVGNPDNTPVIVPNKSDEVCNDLQRLVGCDNLFLYYFNGRGDLFFNKINEISGDEKNSIDFIDSIDSLKKNDIVYEKKYNEEIIKMQQKKELLSKNGFSM